MSGGGGGKDRDKGKGASVSFMEGEKVLAYHRPLLYEAKRRREKINDKLRVLQKLVPNGTKVDLSTMLEEAVLYVKFLQLRIKEVKGYLRDHMVVKESMKFYFLSPGTELINGLVFLHDDEGCMNMSGHITDGGVADIFVEYNGEQDSEEEQGSGSDFEDEMQYELGNESEGEFPLVMTAQGDQNDNAGAEEHLLEQVLVPNGSGVIAAVIRSPIKRANVATGFSQPSQSSQVLNPSLCDSSKAAEHPVARNAVQQGVEEAHTEALKRRTPTNASASNTQPATTSFRPPRAKRNSAATTNEAPGGSTSAGRGRGAKRGRGSTKESPGGSSNVGRGKGAQQGHRSTGGFMVYFTASGNY
ncbi:hypothetical protein ZWY2020_002305 [Hordeum vulgare]|nr:hypothetical protein ZWY2020_002305 [Hordeum vulgare]